MHIDTAAYPSLDGIYALTSYLGDPKWRTLLWIKNVRIYLGDFDNYEDAIKARERYMERH
jgi:outer membrane protein assembly factor BamB